MSPLSFLRRAFHLLAAAVSFFAATAGVLAQAPAPGVSKADAEWAELAKASPIPKLPPEWEKSPPTDEQLVRKTLIDEGQRLLGLAKKARDFRQRFLLDTRRLRAMRLEAQALASAQKLGVPEARGMQSEIDAELLKTPGVSREERMEIRARQVQAAAEAKTARGAEAARDEFEAGARALTTEFPDRTEPWAMLLEVVDRGADPTSRAKLNEIATSNAPASVRERASGMLRRYDALGKPLEMKFTALDGREVDLAAMRGKVVLIDFWATWCEPCIKDLPTLLTAYKSLHELGVEVIGISLDTDKQALEALVRKHGIPWPQYFGGKPSENKYVQQFAVTTIPMMWLVDRKGILRDLNARDGLSKKIENLLAEPQPPAR